MTVNELLHQKKVRGKMTQRREIQKKREIHGAHKAFTEQKPGVTSSISIANKD